MTEVENSAKALLDGSIDLIKCVLQLLGIYSVVLLHQIVSDCIPLIVQHSAPAGNLGTAGVYRDDSKESAAFGRFEGGMVL